MPTKNEVKTQLAALGMKGIAANQRGYQVLHEALRDGETIEAAVAGEYDQRHGAAVATDQRLLFVGMSPGIFNKLRTEEFSYSGLSSIQVKQGRIFGEVEVSASGNKASIDKVANTDAMKFADHVRQRMAQSKAPIMQTAAVDVAGQLERLAKLRDQGILTPTEFDAQKKKLLDL